MPGGSFGNCDDPSVVAQPVFIEGGYAPSKIRDTTGSDALVDACPMLDPSQPLCCNQDNALIMCKYTPSWLNSEHQ